MVGLERRMGVGEGWGGVGGGSCERDGGIKLQREQVGGGQDAD